jgi:hypothetical protein
MSVTACGPGVMQGTPGAVETACVRTLEMPGPWLDVAAPYVDDRLTLARARDAIETIEDLAPALCQALRIGLELVEEDEATDEDTR